MASHRAREEDGFTLIEMLVAAAMSIVLLLALTAILVTTVDQTQRVGAEVDATRQARTALATIENQLHSACIGGGTAPIQAGSTGTDLDFVTYNGTSDAVGSASTNLPVWHDLSFANGSLTDTTYSTSASASGYTQGSQIAAVQVVNNVSALGSNPVFQYFAYQPYLNSTDGNYYWTVPDGTNLQPVTRAPLPASRLSTPLSSSDSAQNAAQNAVEVVIDMTVGSSQRSATTVGVSDAVTDTISLRLSSPPDYSSTPSDTADYGPCQ